MTDRFDERAREIVRSLALVAGIEFRGELLRGFRADDAERTIAAALREEAAKLDVPSEEEIEAEVFCYGGPRAEMKAFEDGYRAALKRMRGEG